jgi:hypothetical protein
MADPKDQNPPKEYGNGLVVDTMIVRSIYSAGSGQPGWDI